MYDMRTKVQGPSRRGSTLVHRRTKNYAGVFGCVWDTKVNMTVGLIAGSTSRSTSTCAAAVRQTSRRTLRSRRQAGDTPRGRHRYHVRSQGGRAWHLRPNRYRPFWLRGWIPRCERAGRERWRSTLHHIHGHACSERSAGKANSSLQQKGRGVHQQCAFAAVAPFYFSTSMVQFTLLLLPPPPPSPQFGLRSQRKAGGCLGPLRKRAHEKRIPPRDVSPDSPACSVGRSRTTTSEHPACPQRRAGPLRPRVRARLTLSQSGPSCRTGEDLLRLAVRNLPQLFSPTGAAAAKTIGPGEGQVPGAPQPPPPRPPPRNHRCVHIVARRKRPATADR